jgi:hypothetical protein
MTMIMIIIVLIVMIILTKVLDDDNRAFRNTDLPYTGFLSIHRCHHSFQIIFTATVFILITIDQRQNSTD